MNYQKLTSKFLVLTVFLALMTALPGCQSGDTGGGDTGDTGTDTEQTTPPSDAPSGEGN